MASGRPRVNLRVLSPSIALIVNGVNTMRLNSRVQCKAGPCVPLLVEITPVQQVRDRLRRRLAREWGLVRMIPSHERILVVATIACLIAAGASWRAVADEGTAEVRLAPAQDSRDLLPGRNFGLVTRELPRQAVLVAAREGLNLPTRDETLGFACMRHG